MEIGKVFTDGVTVGERLRSLDQAKVDSLAESMEAIGLQQPISIYVEGDEPVLVAGRHRLAAAIKLNWGEIDCVFVTLDDLDRQLWEIDENLIRADLTDLERATHTAKRADIMRQRAELMDNLATNSKRGPKSQGQKEFVENTAKKTGKSEKSVRRDKARGEKITPEVRQTLEDARAEDPDSPLGGVPNKGVELDALASLQPEEQEQAVERVESGASDNIRDARDFIKGEQPDEAAVQAQKQYESLCRAWKKAGPEARGRFIKNWIEGAAAV